MDTLSITLSSLAVAMAYVTWQAVRHKNERRDIAVFGALATGFGVGALVIVIT